ncbi:MAG: hypothetical protein RIS94_79 [Pseudomonadota bacterium]|jgi:hypothetical protein
MKKMITTGLVLAASLLAGGAAQAQAWRNDGGYGGGYGGYGNSWEARRDYQNRVMDNVCSGQRGFALEQRLRREVSEGDLDPRTAERIHARIDRIQDRERHECREGDYRETRDVAEQYRQIGYWIDRETNDGWRSRGNWGWGRRGW